MSAITLAIAGRPNVGKSTLFNVLTQSRQALVIDSPGVTRDRLYGLGRLGNMPYQVVDTCGIFGEQEAVLTDSMQQQLDKALDEADAVLFMVDAKAGLLPQDREFAQGLREHDKKTYLIVNKTDGLDPNIACSDFFSLGFDKVIPIAASHKRGVHQMIESIGQDLGLEVYEEEEAPGRNTSHKIAVLGRPNVGKSTLINRMLREQRVVTFDAPGTTRDSIYIPFERYGKAYTLIDTAGLRRKSRIHQVIEKFSVVKTFQAVLDADTVIMVLNAQESIVDQDLNLMRHCMKVGRSIVIAVNKWDTLDGEQKEEFKKELKRKCGFLTKVRVHTISALHGTGVGDLFGLIDDAHDSATQDISTSKLNAILEKALQRHQPPLSRGRRIKLKYAHCTGRNPLKITLFGNQTECLPDSYKRYLQKTFTEALGLVGSPLQMFYKTSDNPYKGRRNKLTPRQQHKKKRMMRFVKKKKGA